MFEEAYQKLNAAQRQAVDTIDGPVLVVAGPGTGKTQLLSMRVANILRRTDVAPQNILCLTFTEEAAHNMRERLASIIGQAAYDVEINTFHGFGASVIARYGEYFYQGIGSTPVDDLAAHTIFRELFAALPHDNPLCMQYEGEFLYERGARTAIDNFKTAGLDPEEVQAIATSNLDFAAIANIQIAKIMDGFARIDKTAPQRFEKLWDSLESIAAPSPQTPIPAFVTPLRDITTTALEAAIRMCQESGKTTSLTEFKNRFLVKDAAGQWQLKDTASSQKLQALASLYDQYLLRLRAGNLLDFNDMITRVVHALGTFDELRLNLQEQYQYILIDEFQDTSLAQLRIIEALTDNPVFEGRPNVLAVGDDDQAIYSFQGAELSNILSFYHLYRDVERISLTDNYRSRQDILDAAHFVISQAQERLVHQLEGLRKDITAKNNSLPEATIAQHRFASADQQYQWVAHQIKAQLASGLSANDIAVIAPKHSGLRAIAPFLQAQGIALYYQKRENILEVPAISELVTIARLLVLLAHNRTNEANALLPEVLSYAFWGLSTRQIWQLYLENNRTRAPWLEIILQSGDTHIKEVGELLQLLTLRVPTDSLEHVLDVLIGSTSYEVPPPASELTTPPQLSLLQNDTQSTARQSPFYNHYFGDSRQHETPLDFLELISHLTFLRGRLRDFYASEQLTLRHFVEYIDLCQGAKIQLVDTTPHRENPSAVSLHTAHSAKGLEFRAVYLIDTNHEIWTASNQQGTIAMPANLPIERAAGSEDERRRLLYVAMTRAKHDLYITGFAAAKRGNAPLKYLSGSAERDQPPALQSQLHEADEAGSQALHAQLVTRWQDRHVAARTQPAMRDLLAPTLERYRLSATHLQTFLDVTQGGPTRFFIECLLRFPKATTPHMALGNAVHQTLDSAHKFLQQTGHPQTTPKLLEEFGQLLRRCHLQPGDEAHWIEVGETILPPFLDARYPHFRREEFFEFDLSNRHLVIDGARVTGKIDRITPLGNEHFRVTDFKTGKASYSWEAQGQSPRKQIQLHQYQQQLALYRLLLEESKAFGPGTHVTQAAIDFVRPTNGKVLDPLEYTPSDRDVARLRALLRAVWQKIMALDLPDTTHYDNSLKGVLEFEEDLLGGN